MQRRYSPDHVGKLFGVTRQTVINWCEDGTMPAVNVARASATRKRWRMSDEDIAAFEARRANKPDSQQAASDRRKSVRRPVKDFFATTGGGK
jgi:predicted site-specific integrase-resolvase